MLRLLNSWEEGARALETRLDSSYHALISVYAVLLGNSLKLLYIVQGVKGRVGYTDMIISLFARGAMVARQVLTLKIEVRVLAGEPSSPSCGFFSTLPN